MLLHSLIRLNEDLGGDLANSIYRVDDLIGVLIPSTWAGCIKAWDFLSRTTQFFLLLDR